MYGIHNEPPAYVTVVRATPNGTGIDYLHRLNGGWYLSSDRDKIKDIGRKEKSWEDAVTTWFPGDKFEVEKINNENVSDCLTNPHVQGEPSVAEKALENGARYRGRGINSGRWREGTLMTNYPGKDYRAVALLTDDGSPVFVLRSTLGKKDPQEKMTPRTELLQEADRLVNSDRNKTYGSPTGNFQDTAKIWTVQLSHKLKDGEVIDPGEVAALIIGLKLARIKASPKKDNWADIAGYAGCGYEADKETGKIDE